MSKVMRYVVSEIESCSNSGRPDWCAGDWNSLFLLHYSRCLSLGPDQCIRDDSKTHLLMQPASPSYITPGASLWGQISAYAMTPRHASSSSQPLPPTLFQVPLSGARPVHTRWLQDTPPHAASLFLLHYSRCLSLGPDQCIRDDSKTHLLMQPASSSYIIPGASLWGQTSAYVMTPRHTSSCSQPLPPTLLQVPLSGARPVHTRWLQDTPLHAARLPLLHYSRCLSLGPDQCIRDDSKTHLFMQPASPSSIIPGASLWGQTSAYAVTPRQTSSRSQPLPPTLLQVPLSGARSVHTRWLQDTPLHSPLFQVPLSGARSVHTRWLQDTSPHAASLPSSIIPGASLWDQISAYALTPRLTSSRSQPLPPPLFQVPLSEARSVHTQWLEDASPHAASLPSSIIPGASLWDQISAYALTPRHTSSCSQPPPPPLFQVPLSLARSVHMQWLQDTPPHAASLFLLHYSRCLSLGPDQCIRDDSKTHLLMQPASPTSIIPGASLSGQISAYAMTPRHASSRSQPLPPTLLQVPLSGARPVHTRWLQDTPPHAASLPHLYYSRCLSLGPDQCIRDDSKTHLFMQPASPSSIIPGASLWGQISAYAMTPRHTSSCSQPLPPPLFQVPLSGARSVHTRWLQDTPPHPASLSLLHYSRRLSLRPDQCIRDDSKTHLLTQPASPSYITPGASLWGQISAYAMTPRHTSSFSIIPGASLWGQISAYAMTPRHISSRSQPPLLHYSRCLALGPDQRIRIDSKTHLLTQSASPTSIIPGASFWGQINAYAMTRRHISSRSQPPLLHYSRCLALRPDQRIRIDSKTHLLTQSASPTSIIPGASFWGQISAYAMTPRHTSSCSQPPPPPLFQVPLSLARSVHMQWLQDTPPHAASLSLLHYPESLSLGSAWRMRDDF